jgi:Ca2+-binding EF-hand superfamily protein
MVITGEGASSSAAPSAPPALSRRIFDKFDTDRSGSIDSKELQRMSLEFGVWLEGNALQMALRAMDHDGNGSISYDEFLKWYKSSSFNDLKLDDVTLQRRNAASKVFTKFDTDGSGSLERNEFAGLFKEIRLLNLTSLSLEDCLEDMDMDGDGTIQFNEFVVWLDRH